MPVAGWGRLWRNDRGEMTLPGAVTRAAVQGENLGRILELAAQGLLEFGPAERAGVWLEGAPSARAYQGTVVEPEAFLLPAEWKRLDISAPFFQKILSSREPLEVLLDDSSGVTIIGPLTGMRRAVWLPLHIQHWSLGLALAATTHPRRALNASRLQALADELALVVGERREHEQSEQRQGELTAHGRLQQAILRGTPLHEILPEISRQAAQHASARFIAIGWYDSAQAGTPRFEVFAGLPEWSAWMHAEPLISLWRSALEHGRASEVSSDVLRSLWPETSHGDAERVARVVALPLDAHGQRLGVLVAGLENASASSAAFEEVEPYSTLTSAALWEERRRKASQEIEGIGRPQLGDSNEPALALDKDGIIREASRLALDLLHLEPATLGRFRIEELFPVEARPAIAAWREAVCLAAPSHDAVGPIEGLSANGLTLRLHLRRPPPEREGYAEVAVEDVTALRAAEREAGRAQAELLTLLDSIDTGALLFDVNGRIRLVNDRFAQLTGLEPQRIAELANFGALVNTLAGHFLDPGAFAARWRELVRRSDESSWEELELIRPTPKVVERFARPVLGSAGERLGWLEVYRDLTTQRLIQSKLLQAEKMAALGQLVSGIAHELNNPLTSIMGYAQLLLGHSSGPERDADASMIYQEAERAGRIVKNLLLFARESTPERRPVNLNEIVERTLALRSYELKLENIQIDYQLDPDLPTTLADPTQMQQVVLNLIVNAEQAIQQGRGQGRLSIRTQRLSAGRLALEIADDGPGMAPEVASRAFDPFFTTKPAGVGTGLGLSIVYGIVQQHGGEISVDSKPGHGTRFVLELPVAAPPAVAAEPAPTVSPAPPASAGSTRANSGSGAAVRGRRERILVVEDEPTVAQLIADVLREEGHRVDTVLDSREALERIVRHEYDLLVCDLKMPHVDGRAVYRSLVRSGNPLQHRLIFVTGDTLAAHTLEFLDSSGLPYLAKPFLVEELKLVVQRALEGAAAGVGVAAGHEARPAPAKAAELSRSAARKR